MTEKLCACCNQIKSIEHFWKRARAKDGFTPSCIDCVRKQNQQSYKNHWVKNRKRIDCNHYRKVEELREWVNQIKHEHGCLFCEQNEPVCLQFHHIKKETKYLCISALINRKQKQKIEEEMKKCVVVCANCHLKLHSGILVLPAVSSPTSLNSFPCFRRL